MPQSLRWLQWKLAKKASSRFVTSLKTKDGRSKTKSSEILAEFTDFYTNLYRSSNPPLEKIKLFLPKYQGIKRLTEEHHRFLDNPITMEELSTVLKSLKNSKATGRDGLPIEFYKRFAEDIIPPRLETCNKVLTTGEMPKSWSEARIVVFPKPGKDPSMVESYRPISLLNHDAKVFASVLAHRLNKIIASYIHQDQTGFMPTRQLADNVRWTLNLINYCETQNTPMLILALDAEKAFDCVETKYLLHLMETMNFGPNFLRAIQTLYNEPRAQLVVNDLRSEDFMLTRGTRQGCPLSPILFAIFLEPLAEAIRNTADISGVTVGDKRHVVSMFADDTVLYLIDPVRSLTVLMPLIKDFGEISGFAINPSKTELYPVGLSDTLRTQLQAFYKFRWVTSHWRHLGILVPLNLRDLFKVNYTPLFNKVNNNLHNWSTKWLSWIERIEMIRSTVLPQFLFLFQSLPIEIPKKNSLYGKRRLPDSYGPPNLTK